MALELDALLRARNLSRAVWQNMLRFLDGRLSALEASKNVDERIREDVIGRGLTVINDHLQPALDDASGKVAQIETLRASADAIHDQLQEALEFGANTDLVTEGPGGLNRYFTPVREQALKDDLRGAGISVARDTLKEISDALDAQIAAIRGGVSTQYDTLAEIAAAIGALQTSLTIKSDVGHTHTISAVSGLQGQLDAKASALHTHTPEDIIGFYAALGTYKIQRWVDGVANYTLVPADLGGLILMTSGSPMMLTIPATGFPTSGRVDIIQFNVGQVTIAGAAGVNLLSFNNARKLAGRWAGATVIGTGAGGNGDWVIVGNLVA